MRCKNEEEICFCHHPLDGTFINGWLPERLRNYKLKDTEDRIKVIKELECLANDLFGMWKQTC